MPVNPGPNSGVQLHPIYAKPNNQLSRWCVSLECQGISDYYVYHVVGMVVLNC